MIKDTEEQPDEVQRVKSGRVLSTGASVPMEQGWDERGSHQLANSKGFRSSA